MTAVADCILVMLEAIPFHGLMQRHQHMARELSRYMPVVYVEETPSMLKRFLEWRPFDPLLWAYKRGLQDIGENLKLFKAPPCVPRSTGYRRSLEATVRRTARSLKPLLPPDRPVILWLCSPSALGAPGLYGEVLSVLDCYDAFGEFPGEEKFRDEIIAAMNELAGKVDLALATNNELQERLAEHNENTAIVKNGCDAEHFVGGGREPSEESRILDMDALPRPIIGYMGDIAPWLDIESLELAARRHPDWSVVLLGTWKRGDTLSKDLPNIHAPGRVPYDELPHYARRFDVGTVPFELTELTRVVNPLKLYEYFALGMPVVATALPEVSHHEDLVYIGRSPDEFVALLELAVKEKSDAPVRRRREEVARENSWRARGEAVKALFEGML